MLRRTRGLTNRLRIKHRLPSSNNVHPSNQQLGRYFRRSVSSTSDGDGDSNEPVALGIDFGTDSVRCAMFALDGKLVGDVISSCSYSAGTISPTPNRQFKGLALDQLAPKTCLQDADDWVNSLRQCTQELRRDTGINPSRVQSIGLCFTSSTVLPCDAHGVPLYQTKPFRGEHAPHAWYAVVSTPLMWILILC